MVWTLAVLLLILSLLLVHFLKAFVEKVKRSYFVYPSDAVIDQVLPQEIMEHMMTFLDPRAMIECRLVSKYWHHHATKPNIEMEALERARQRLREVYRELNENGITIANQEIEAMMTRSRATKDSFFLRASALASKHGADLIFAESELSHHIFTHVDWSQLKAKKKYFLLTSGYNSYAPWHFSLSNNFVGTKPMFDEATVEWEETFTYNLVLDTSPFPAYNPTDVKLYMYEPINAPKYFYFLPLSAKMFHVLIFLFAPMIAHDILHSNFLPTIKSWFGPIMFICAVILQLLIVHAFIREYTPARDFKIALAVFSISYILLTYLAYPASMSVFAGIGVQALMFFYYLLAKEYFFPYGSRALGKKKIQVLIIGLSMIFFMIDWKLVVASIMDLTFFGTLFNNTVHYNIVLLLFIFFNFLSSIKQYGFHWRHLITWESGTFVTLRNNYMSVVLMTLIAPTWRGNHL